MKLRRLEDVAIGRDNNFNLIRAMAAAGVMFSHAYALTSGRPAEEPLRGWLHGTSLGTICVFVFFATSGFFITASYERRRSNWDFLWARLLRIYPAMIVMMIVMLPLIGLLGAAGQGFWPLLPEVIARQLLFEYTPIPGIFPQNPLPDFNGSLWTLRYEVMCYLFVVICGVAGLLRARRSVVLILPVAIAFHLAVPPLTQSYGLRALAELGLPFAFGMTAYLCRRVLVMHPGILAVLVLLTVLSYWLPAFAGPGFGGPVFDVLMIATIAYGVLLLGYLDVPVLRHYNRIGDYSYGLYIYAFPVQEILIAAGIDAPLPNAFAALIVTLGLAVLSWHVVEEPALKGRARLTALCHNLFRRKGLQ